MQTTHNVMPWIDVMAHPPELGAWALVLVDYWSSDMGQGEARHKLFKLGGRFSVKTAVLMGYDSEGWPIWHTCSHKGFPMNGYHEVRYVTHYQPLNTQEPDKETWEMPEWCTWDTPKGMYA